MRSIHDPRYQDLIKKLIELRESKHVTQVELARLLNKPQSYVSKVEILERRLDVIELLDWLKVLDTDITVLITSCTFKN
ncbi:transcriptional regulator [Acinetobacter indicus]|uniref:helix-turn-helix domain-containing protein n=1 Tax=Acinetobacter indicus TaxID=756892 RepID=UPI0005F7E2A5|nr:helix-turn-helix transcriptional regulator [Acinetobacter indicus]KJV40146.1 DNA-binding protein [Acinetobacter indicus]OUY11658.1 transcriptional regulator [Acinetobacter indicus]